MNQKQAIRDAFWSPFRETVRREGIPYQWLALNDRVPGAEPSHWMRNFRAAASGKPGAHGGCVFQDSDGAKWLEGVAYSLRSHPDPALEAIADGAIEAIVAAQQPDGYLDTYYILTGLDRRWTNLRDNHELYCAGHMIEAAVAYYESTGKRALLDAMLRYVDLIDREIGPRRGQRHGYPGHPEIELALMRLYRLTGDEKHLRLAKYFIDERGQKPLYFEQETRESGNDFPWKDSPFGYQYYQAGKPVRKQTEAEGHAVRAMYLYCGMADVARATGDESLVRACEALWESTVRRRMYVTGAIGSSAYGESFTFDYDLPNDTVYGETCAAIGLVFFARRMLALKPRGEYADVMERALYNGVLSGMQLDGKRFFYVNPLEVNPVACAKDPNKRHVKPERQKWFGCACCPPNLIRLLMSLEDYVCSADGNALHVHLYIGGDFTARVGSSDVRLHVETRYPWGGDICLNVELERPASFALALRIPEWCRKWQIGLNRQARRGRDRLRDGVLPARPRGLCRRRRQDAGARRLRLHRARMEARRPRSDHAGHACAVRAGQPARRRGRRQGRADARAAGLLSGGGRQRPEPAPRARRQRAAARPRALAAPAARRRHGARDGRPARIRRMDRPALRAGARRARDADRAAALDSLLCMGQPRNRRNARVGAGIGTA